MEKNKFEKERETIIFSIWQVFRKSHNISERYYFWTRKHIEVGLNFSLAAGSDVMYLCFYVFWKCPGKFFAWTLLVESWSTGRRIHNSRSYVFMFFMYLRAQEFVLKFENSPCCTLLATIRYSQGHTGQRCQIICKL